MSKKSREKRKQREAEWLELCEKIVEATKPKKHFIDTFVESAETIDDICYFIEERCSDFDNQSYRVTVDIVEERLIPLMPSVLDWWRLRGINEKAAIFHYTRGDTSAFRQLNNQLRKGNLSEFNEAFSELLSSGLSKIEPVEQTVYRTVRLNKTKLGNYVNLSLKGGEDTFKGFTSASTEMDIAWDFAQNHAGKKKNETDVLFVITGKSGKPIEELSQFGGRFEGKLNQHEVLFDKGLHVRFDRVERKEDKYVFYLTEM